MCVEEVKSEKKNFFCPPPGFEPGSPGLTLFTYYSAVCLHFQNLAAAAAAGGIGVRPSFATGMAGIPHAATGLSLQAAIANQAAYGQALPAT